jgi:hypothetical protein
MGSSRIKMGSRKYGPLPASCPISIFFHKYGNRHDKYRNTGGMGWNFSICSHPYCNPSIIAG